MITLQNIAIVAICLWISFLWSRRKYYKLIFKMPGELGLPLIGLIYKTIHKEEILQTFGNLIEKHGSLLCTWMGPFPVIVITEPQIAQDILTSPACINKSITYKAVGNSIGDGLFSLKNPDWSVHRKLLNPAFNHSILLSFFPIFNDEVNDLLITLDELCGSEEVDLTKTFHKLTLNIATRTTMGTKLAQVKTSSSKDLLECYSCALETTAEMCYSPWLNLKLVQRLLGKYAAYTNAKNEIRKFTRDLIHERLSSESGKSTHQANAANAKFSNIFINIAVDLLKKGQFTQQNVEDESNVIIFGAFETTANTVAYVLMLLAMFPTYQQKAFDEIVSIFSDVGRFEVTYADVQQMPYMDMIINESMRLIAPLPLVARQTSADVQLSNGLVIPEGTQIVLDIFHMHRRIDIWGSQAHTFNPEHFLPSNMEGKHPYAFIPFTKGLRNCIGSKYGLLSVKVALAKLIRNYQFTTSFQFQNLVYVENITMQLKKRPLFKIFKREK